MKKIYFLLFFVSFGMSINAQLQVDTNVSDDFLLDWIEGAAITVTNLTIECDSGSYGKFLNPDANNDLQVYEGILFTTGDAMLAIGPNNMGSATAIINSGVSDVDLEQSIPGYTTNDVCRVEFDAVPDFNYLLFNYAFGSEEYLEWVGSSFNDVFGFFISGPGIEGPYTNDAQNYSVVPGTDTPVSINNVHDGLNAEYYINNGDGVTEPFLSDPLYIQYDGLTTNMPGIIEVTPGETYHCKIAVGDAGDSALDSGIFLQRESFMSVESIGVVEESLDAIAIFPNPAENNLMLRGANMSNVNAYQIMNVEGKIIASESVNQTNLDLDISDLESGYYFLRLNAKDGNMKVLPWVKK